MALGGANSWTGFRLSSGTMRTMPHLANFPCAGRPPNTLEHIAGVVPLAITVEGHAALCLVEQDRGTMWLEQTLSSSRRRVLIILTLLAVTLTYSIFSVGRLSELAGSAAQREPADGSLNPSSGNAGFASVDWLLKMQSRAEFHGNQSRVVASRARSFRCYPTDPLPTWTEASPPSIRPPRNALPGTSRASTAKVDTNLDLTSVCANPRPNTE